MRTLLVSITRLRCFQTAILIVALASAVALMVTCSGTTTPMQMNNAMGTINVTMSDPPSCAGSSGTFAHVFVTVQSVKAHTSATADANSAGWQELAPQLATQPMQIDLFSTAQTNCVLAQLGSAQLPPGSYQQIRLILLSNTPNAGSATPATNACAGNGFNCVVLNDITGTIHELQLSSQDETGLKIPPGQIVGGPIQVTAGQSVDLNIDFNACASILLQGNGQYRLKPTLTAGQVNANNSGISGQIVDSLTKAPITGPVLVAIEQTDSTGIDRIRMEASADANGNFRFCPLPTGTFDIVAVALGPKNLPYNATSVLNVPNGQSLGPIPLVAEAGASGPAVLQGFVTATAGTTPAQIDAAMAALQTISVPGGTTRQLSIPLEAAPATLISPAQASTNPLALTSTTACPAGSPSNADCAQYTLVVPASNPSVGVFSASGFTYSLPASGDVLFSVDAIATRPGSGGASICTPAEQITSKDMNGQPLKVTSGTITNAAELDFSVCN
jgi:hypothetical protein